MRGYAHAAAMNAPRAFTRLPLRVMACLAIACLAIAACNRTTPDVVITQATFGVYRTAQPGRSAFEASDVVPFVAGQQYGWLIRLDTSRPHVHWREELILPSAPKTWGSERVGYRTIAADNRSIVTERDVRTDSGYIFNAWKIEPGDPAGRYTLTVSIQDGPSHTFAFEVK